jgi:hypothetical protein
MSEYFGHNKAFNKYSGRDISCALARYSYREEDINAAGYSSLLERELAVMKDWLSLFL